MKAVEISIFILCLSLALSLFNQFGFVQENSVANGMQIIELGSENINLNDTSLTQGADRNGSFSERIYYYANDKSLVNSGIQRDDSALRSGIDMLKSLTFFSEIIWNATGGLKSMMLSLDMHVIYANIIQTIVSFIYILAFFQIVSGQRLEA